MTRRSIPLLGVLLASCAIGPQYSPPALDVPDAFRDQVGVPTKESLADLSWWDVYRDPTLRDLLKTAVDQNRDIKIAAARVSEARAQAAIVRVAQFPQVNADITGQRGRVFQSGDYATGQLFSAEAQLSFELDLWGRLSSLSDAARSNLLATEFARDGVTSSLVGDTATAYFDLISFDQQLRITQRTVGVRQRFLDLTQSRLRNGAAAAVDVNRADASLAGTQAIAADLKRQIAQTENRLRILLGENPAPITRPDIDLQALPPPPDVPPGLPSSLLERRPDLRQAEAILIGATANIRAAKAALFPTISLTGLFGWESLDLSRLFTGPTKIWGIGLDVLQPLINAQRNRYQVEATQARAEQALLQYQSAVAQAFREVSDALVARQHYEEQLRAQEQQVKALQDASARILRRYEVGYSSYFEVIDADSSLYAAQLLLVQARRNSLVNVVQLYKALGGGWDHATAVSTAFRTFSALPL
ncbi:MAG TPA: efflux transporter outer membrane subunit [Casimicrobiaceae bacterium]